jgi:hypothetical protein
MDHAEIAAMRGHGWAVGAWTVLVAATILGLATERTLQLINADFPFGTHPDSSTTTAASAPSALAGARHDALPLLAVPNAVTRARHTMVAEMKHHSAPIKQSSPVRNGLNGKKGLLAGLALLGASQPH